MRYTTDRSKPTVGSLCMRESITLIKTGEKTRMRGNAQPGGRAAGDWKLDDIIGVT